MSIRFDDIHTPENQNSLDRMMQEVTKFIHCMNSKWQRSETCPVCGGGVAVFTVKYGFGIDKCGDCGLIFCNPYPTEEQLHYYYNSEMKTFENDFFMKSFEKRVELFLPRIDIIHKYKKEGKLLDIGSSVGIFIEALNRTDHKFHITCCDISKDATNRLKKRYPDITVINSNYRYVRGKYKIITMWDTVEHIVDLDELFDDIWNMLCGNGIFIFSTPNTKSFEWISAKENHVQLLPPGHVNLLNIDVIKTLLDRHGFELLEAVTLNPSLDIDYTLKIGQAGPFLEEMLLDKSFRGSFEKLLIEYRLAGNIVVTARNKCF